HLPEHSLEGKFPAGTQGRDTQSALYFVFGGLWKIEQCIDSRDRQAFRSVAYLDDLIAGSYLALFEHTKVEPGAVMLDEQSRHTRLIHAYAHAVAGHTRLRHFEQRPSDPIAIAYADLAVGQTFDGEVFSELPEGEIAPLEFTLPVAIRIHLVDKHRAVLSTVTAQITLCVAIDVGPANQATSLHRLLPYRRVYSLTAPCDLAGMTDVDRQQPCQ